MSPATPPARSGAVTTLSSGSVGPGRRSIDSLALLQGQSEVLIQHGEVTYHLRHTRNGKLILTK